MLENLSERLQGIFSGLRSKGRLTEDDINAAMREIRLALLEADVNFKVVKNFVARTKERCLTAEVLDSLTPAQNVVKIVLDELTELLGRTDSRLVLGSRIPNVIMLVGLQGSGKTTAAAKLAYRLKQESIVERGATADMPTEWGHFRITAFRQKSNGLEHIAITKGEWSEDEPVLVRVHSSCATGDILGSCRCDCGAQLHEAMRMVEKEGRGAIVYLNQEGRGIGLFNKIEAYKLQEEGLDTVDANVRLGFGIDERDYGVGASIIRELGIKHMRLMTNNPLKRAGLEGYGLTIDEIVPIVIAPNPYNLHYLETKEKRMHHTLGLCKHA